MKKSVLVFGVLSGLANLTYAQSSVTIYGVMDAGIVHESGGAAGSILKLTSGVQSGSRLGFRGSEDLGGGLSANFVLESGFQIDTGASGQGGLLFGRQAYVGLNGDFGAITLGRQYTPHYLSVFLSDPFASGLAGTNTTVMAISGARMNNAIKYATPDFHGFSGDLAYGFGETAGSTSANSAYGGSLGYTSGPLAVRLAYHNKNTNTPANGGVPARNTDAKNTFLTATYDFSMAKVYFGYGVNKGLDSSPYLIANPYGAAVAPASSTDSRDISVGVSIPYGANTFLATYIRKDDRDPANRDADMIGVGYLYALSKRTNLYAAYARINNKNGAAYTVGSAIEAGSGNKGLNLGVRHVF